MDHRRAVSSRPSSSFSSLYRWDLIGCPKKKLQKRVPTRKRRRNSNSQGSPTTKKEWQRDATAMRLSNDDDDDDDNDENSKGVAGEDGGGMMVLGAYLICSINCSLIAPLSLSVCLLCYSIIWHGLNPSYYGYIWFCITHVVYVSL